MNTSAASTITTLRTSLLVSDRPRRCAAKQRPGAAFNSNLPDVDVLIADEAKLIAPITTPDYLGATPCRAISIPIIAIKSP